MTFCQKKPISVSRRCIPLSFEGYEQILQGIINLQEMLMAIDNLKILATINGVRNIILHANNGFKSLLCNTGEHSDQI